MRSSRIEVMLIKQRESLDTPLNCALMSGLTKSFTAVLFAINSHCLVFTLAK